MSIEDHRTTVLRSLRRSGAVLAIVVLVAGVPAALWALAGNPLPGGLPSWADLDAALTRGRVAETTLVKVLALVCWFAWLQLVVALAIEATEARRHRVPGRLPVLGGARRLAALLIAGLAISALGSRERDRPPLRPLDEALPALTTAQRGLTADDGGEPDPLESAEPPRASEVTSNGAPSAPPVAVHVVERRDTLWGIAGSRLGDPLRWPEIFEHNRDRRQADGRHLSDPHLIHPGWILEIPGEASARAPAPPATPNAAPAAPDEAETTPSGTHDTAKTHDTVDIDDTLVTDGSDGDSDPVVAADDSAAPTRHRLVTPDDAVAAPDDPVAAADDAERAAREADEAARAVLESLRASTPDETAQLDETAKPTDPVEPEAPTEPHDSGIAAPEPSDDPGPPPSPSDPLPEPSSEASGEGDEADAEPATPRDSSPGLRLPAAESWPEQPAGPLAGEPAERAPSTGSETAEVVDPELHPTAAVGALPARPDSPTALLAGAGLLAGGIVWSLDRLRRRREARRMAGELVPAPDAGAVRVEAALRETADPDLVKLVGVALASFGDAVRARAGTAPPLVGINVARELSLLFAAPAPDPAPGFEVEDAGFSWVATTETLRHRRAGGPVPVPALFTLGVTTESQVLLDAEAVDRITVTGAPGPVHELLFTVATELATGPWSEGVELVLVGFGRELEPLGGVSVVETAEEAASLVRDRVAGLRARCRERGSDSLVDARLTEPGADWRPAVVICAGSSGDTADAHLDSLATGGPGLTTIAARTAAATAGDGDGGVHGDLRERGDGASWRIEVTDDEVELHPVGVRLTRHRLAREARSDLHALVREAGRVTATGARPAGRDPRPAARPGADPVVVRVLGPVEVESEEAPLPFDRKKALELVAYLATHRRGVDADTLSEALWPGRLVPASTLHTIASRARAALGDAPDGTPRLPHVGADGLYRLHPSVELDEDRFVHLTSVVEGTVEEQRSSLREALELVRGRPFTTPGTEYVWAHSEALVSAVTAEIADAAHRLATLALERGDAREAWWATRQGLLASPTHEELHRDRMRTADLAGDPDSVEEVMSELCTALDVGEDERHELLHPETMRVYQHLTRRRAGPTLVRSV